MMWRRHKPEPEPVEWELRVTTPDGILVQFTTADLETIWRFGDRSTDGYVDLLGGQLMPRMHLWVKPAGWTESNYRIAQLDGSAALPDGMRRYR